MICSSLVYQFAFPVLAVIVWKACRCDRRPDNFVALSAFYTSLSCCTLVSMVINAPLDYWYTDMTITPVDLWKDEAFYVRFVDWLAVSLLSAVASIFLFLEDHINPLGRACSFLLAPGFLAFML